MLSLLRVLQLFKIINSIVILTDKAQEVYFTKRILIENIKNIWIRCFSGLLMLHTLACFWIIL